MAGESRIVLLNGAKHLRFSKTKNISIRSTGRYHSRPGLWQDESNAVITTIQNSISRFQLQ
jgi:hypothetical protein